MPDVQIAFVISQVLKYLWVQLQNLSFFELHSFSLVFQDYVNQIGSGLALIVYNPRCRKTFNDKTAQLRAVCK